MPDIIPYNRVETEREIPKLKFILTKGTLGVYGNSYRE